MLEKRPIQEVMEENFQTGFFPEILSMYGKDYPKAIVEKHKDLLELLDRNRMKCGIKRPVRFLIDMLRLVKDDKDLQQEADKAEKRAKSALKRAEYRTLLAKGVNPYDTKAEEYHNNHDDDEHTDDTGETDDRDTDETEETINVD